MTYTGKAADFAAGHALFYGDMLAFVNQLREMTSDFGIIPMPKYDEAQESYGEYISNGWTTAYAVPMTNGDPERTGVILEVLSGYSTDTVRQALYAVSLSAKLVRDADSVEMLDIIFGSKSYDWAVDFTWGSELDSSTLLSAYSCPAAEADAYFPVEIGNYWEYDETHLTAEGYRAKRCIGIRGGMADRYFFTDSQEFWFLGTEEEYEEAKRSGFKGARTSV